MINCLPPELENLTKVENDYSSSPHLDSRSIGISLISAAAESRKLTVDPHRGLVYELCSDRRRVAFLQNSPENSTVFSYCAKNKHLAKILLAREGVPVPLGSVFTEYDDALNYFEKFGSEVAIKPLDGSHGTGVSTGISSKENFLSAWQVAKASGEQVIVEQSIKGYDLRVIVIGGRAVAAYIRVPANVVGDGTSTIRDLVEQKNQRRKLNPSTRKDFLSRFDLLEREGRSLEDVPEKDERVWLASVANVSVGGEVVQFIDQVSPNVLRVAEQAANAFPGLPQVGVDLIVGESEGKENICVIEVNSNPGISDAVFPSYGRSINVPHALIEYMFDKRETALREDPVSHLMPASPYAYASEERLLSKSFLRQQELIKQAAYSNNIKVEDISTFVFVLSLGDASVTFYKGIPDRTNVISRKISRNRTWLQERMEQKKIAHSFESESEAQLNQYRLVLIDNAVVAGISGGSYSGRKGESCQFDQLIRDITEEVHPGFAEIAVKSVNAIFNPFLAGIDIIAQDIGQSPEAQRWKVSDVVCNPFLSWHHFPDSGLGRDLASALVQALFPQLKYQPIESRCVFVTVKGSVQGAEFRDWIQRKAVLHGVAGWVRQTPGGEVEILMEGAPNAIEEILRLPEHSPYQASVSDVQDKACSRSGFRSFQVCQ